MLKKITKKQAFEQLSLPILTYNNFDLHWTDYEDTSLIVNLCYGRKSILEIGTHLGYTVENIARNNMYANILTIDICRGYNVELKYQNSEILERNESGIKIKCPNIKHEIIDSNTFFQTNKALFDVILIDGDHSYEQVQKDTENATRFLSKGGVLIWHDVYNKDNSCEKCKAEPDNDDVAEYLRHCSLPCYKIDKSWIAFYEHI
jgi:predicted O-methyltransferase YrrM